MEINIDGKQYTMSTNLRVPYEMQKEFGNKPYTQIFEGMQTSSLEDQIKIIYVSFRLNNAGIYTFRQFLDIILDTWELNTVITTLETIINTLTGGMPEAQEKKVVSQTE